MSEPGMCLRAFQARCVLGVGPGAVVRSAPRTDQAAGVVHMAVAVAVAYAPLVGIDPRQNLYSNGDGLQLFVSLQAWTEFLRLGFAIGGAPAELLDTQKALTDRHQNHSDLFLLTIIHWFISFQG